MSTTPQPSAAVHGRSLAITGARALVFDELRQLDIGIDAGVIVELGQGLTGTYAEQIDATGLVALPGLIDTAPLPDLPQASAAAAQGGFTTLFGHADTDQAWRALLAQLQGQCWVDYAVAVQARPDGPPQPPLEGQRGYAGPLLAGDAHTAARPAELPSLMRSGRMRALAALGPQQPLLPLLDAAMQTLRPLHLLGLSNADDLALLRRHPARRLVSAALALSDLLHGPVDAAPEPLWQALRDGTAALLAGGNALEVGDRRGAGHLTTTLPLLLDLLQRGQLTLAELGAWTAQKPAQAFQLQGKGGLLPGLDGDVVLVDLQQRREVELLLPGRDGPQRHQRLLQGGPVMTISRGQLVCAHGEMIGPSGGAAVQLAPPLAILPR